MNSDDYNFMLEHEFDGISPEDAPLVGCLHTLATVAILFVAMLLCIVFGGCKSVKYVPVVEHRTDTLRFSRDTRDSIYLHDSIYIHEWMAGETVYVQRDRWRTQYIEKQVHDTTYVAIHDTIPDPYPVEVKVEKQLSWWQKTRMYLGNVMLCLLIVLIVYKKVKR